MDQLQDIKHGEAIVEKSMVLVNPSSRSTTIQGESWLVVQLAPSTSLGRIPAFLSWSESFSRLPWRSNYREVYGLGQPIFS